jgi:hypothetical protein
LRPASSAARECARRDAVAVVGDIAYVADGLAG